MQAPSLILLTGAKMFSNTGSCLRTTGRYLLRKVTTLCLKVKKYTLKLSKEAGRLASLALKWLSQDHVLAVIAAWVITFAVVFFLILALGFGPAGIIAGSAAAAFQAFMYGAFTPAGGIFAMFTSAAMLGTLCPHAAIAAAVIATIVAFIVWKCGVGRKCGLGR